MDTNKDIAAISRYVAYMTDEELHAFMDGCTQFDELTWSRWLDCEDAHNKDIASMVSNI